MLLLAALEAGITGGSKLVLELLDAAGRVHELQLARIERMAHVADIDLQLLASAARRKPVPAAAGDLGDKVIWMNAVFHDRSPGFGRTNHHIGAGKARQGRTVGVSLRETNGPARAQ
jgi:hypothetical protein